METPINHWIIGAILQSANITDLLGKIGINPVIIKSGELKAVPNPAAQIDEEKLNYLKDIIEKMQKEFLMIVKKNRKISESVLNLVSDGRILTGRQAKNLKLIDDIGSEKDALDWLKKAGVDQKIKIIDFSSKTDFEKIFNLTFLKKSLIIYIKTFIMVFLLFGLQEYEKI